MPPAIKRGLGRGLGALISEADITLPQPGDPRYSITLVDINQMEPNRQQPRKYFDEEALSELADSIREYGILQPILVKEENGYYSIIAGERRWRAARIAKLEKVPVLIKDYTEREALQIALIENLQRQDLNPIEEAVCYKKLIDDFFFTQDDIASKIGKSRNSVSYAVSLLALGSRVQEYIIESKLTAAHGRLLTQVKDANAQLTCANKIIERQMTVRDAEKLVQVYISHEATPAAALQPRTFQMINYEKVEEDLKNILGTKVSIHDGRKKGKIEIEFYSKDELDRLIGLIKNTYAGGQ
ncbi:MAG: ParB/RepB/Spo0J family partition protein [Clostridiales bacterium]|jgi:ParB family chromosome partitioning protein|nr:ParB/RepB/Spo0J family partition protein [Clostridiales bacterium]